jgi:hypothetical protein
MATKMKSKSAVFMYKGEPYMKIVPVKRLFNSTMIHEVITRGDFFAVNLLTNVFTVLPAGANDPTQMDFLDVPF